MRIVLPADDGADVSDDAADAAPGTWAADGDAGNGNPSVATSASGDDATGRHRSEGSVTTLPIVAQGRGRAGPAAINHEEERS